MKKSVVLGSSGFTGRNLINRLKKESGFEVVGVDNLADGSRVDHVCDLRDYGAVDEIVAND